MPIRQDLRLFEENNGIYVRKTGVLHRNDEYDDCNFDILFRMQREHFWYCGRHRFLLCALENQLSSLCFPIETLSAVDLGTGCGGWISYLIGRHPDWFRELALADSSYRALELAAGVVGPQVLRFQVDLYDLGWNDRWDVAFLLDVLEHIPDQVSVLQQIRECLKPDGFLFFTAPALDFFWSYNDDLAKHQRRYSMQDLKSLADQCDLKLIKARYFMFFLSPLLYLSRLCGPKIQNMSPAQIRNRIQQTHKVPAKPLNALLRGIFSMESPLGFWLPFPWGTSILGIFQKSPVA